MTNKTQPSFLMTTYNVLAQSYVKPERYRHSPAGALDESWRTGAVADQVATLGSDLICLQEVEPKVFEATVRRVEDLGYQSHFLSKDRGRPDGCATLFDPAVLELKSVVEHHYLDGRGGEPDSGHVAQILVLEIEGRTLAVANTHLRWDPPDTPVRDQIGYRQVLELLDTLAAVDPAADATIVCGDFNAEPDSDLVKLCVDRGFRSSHSETKNANTSNAGGMAKTIDFIFHTTALDSVAVELPLIEDFTAMPSDEYPSDHLPVQARLCFSERDQ